MNYSIIYVLCVVLMMSYVVSNYSKIVMSWGFSLDQDNSLMKDLNLEDNTDNRLRILNIILFVSVIFAPITLVYLLAGKLAD